MTPNIATLGTVRDAWHSEIISRQPPLQKFSEPLKGLKIFCVLPFSSPFINLFVFFGVLQSIDLSGGVCNFLGLFLSLLYACAACLLACVWGCASTKARYPAAAVRMSATKNEKGNKRRSIIPTNPERHTMRTHSSKDMDMYQVFRSSVGPPVSWAGALPATLRRREGAFLEPFRPGAFETYLDWALIWHGGGDSLIYSLPKTQTFNKAASRLFLF